MFAFVGTTAIPIPIIVSTIPSTSVASSVSPRTRRARIAVSAGVILIVRVLSLGPASISAR